MSHASKPGVLLTPGPHIDIKFTLSLSKNLFNLFNSSFLPMNVVFLCCNSGRLCLIRTGVLLIILQNQYSYRD